MLSLPSEIELDRAIAQQSFAGFVRSAWHVLEPASELKWGWSLDAICEHLEAVTNGEIKRLLMNVPPGCMKSLLTGVLWPAWEWGPKGLPGKRYLGTAHKQDLAVRDNLKARRLIQSEWYQARWPIKLTGDQNAKTKFENDFTGFREAMAFTSMTGSRGDRVILDDPLSVDHANSDADLRAAELTFTEALPTRVNNDESAIVVIMQRLNEKDTSGIILKRDLAMCISAYPCALRRNGAAQLALASQTREPKTANYCSRNGSRKRLSSVWKRRWAAMQRQDSSSNGQHLARAACSRRAGSTSCGPCLRTCVAFADGTWQRRKVAATGLLASRLDVKRMVVSSLWMLPEISYHQRAWSVC